MAIAPGIRHFAASRGARTVAAFLLAETIIFTALLVVFLTAGMGHNGTWPPEGQPRFPMFITGLNMVVLFFSAYAFYRALDPDRGRPFHAYSHLWLTATLLGGMVFLAAQGVEWIRLVGFGLGFTSNLYNQLFYTIVALHGLHVAVGVAILAVTWWRAFGHPWDDKLSVTLAVCRTYWYFVVGVWPVLYVLVYTV